MLQENPQYKLRRDFADWLRRNPARLQECKGRGWLRPGYVIGPNGLDIRKMACVWEAFALFRGVAINEIDRPMGMMYKLPQAELGMTKDQVSRITDFNDSGFGYEALAGMIESI